MIESVNLDTHTHESTYERKQTKRIVIKNHSFFFF